MVTCVVPGCDSSKNNTPNKYTFHIFPKCIDMREKWLKMLNRGKWVPKKNSTICSKHFDQKCFARGLKRTNIRSCSIPTLFMPVELKPTRKASTYVYRDVSSVSSSSTANAVVVDNTQIKMKKTIDVLKKRLVNKVKVLKNVRAQRKRAVARGMKLCQALETLESRSSLQYNADAQEQSLKSGGGEGSASELADVPVPASIEAEPVAEEVVITDTPAEEEIKQELEEVKTEIVEEPIQSPHNPHQGDWQQREQDLLKKIEELEKVKGQRSVDGLKLELKVREEEIDLLKARVKNLETELQAALSKPGGKNQEVIEKIKQQHEELLSKAKGMIFDKTKMVKNQELQIEALTTQVQSLKDINQITKDLLEIRNSEVKAMEDRFQALEGRFKGEKERYDLVLKRAQTSSTINDDLRKEYETQLAIFKELREKYEQRVKALVEENNRLKESVKGGPSG